MSETLKATLQRSYEALAAHTLPACASCRVPYSCCDAMYCDFTIQIAKDLYDVDLERTDHPTLPLMGAAGCTAAPHLRPFCTKHTCAINGMGTSGDPAWDDTYFELVEEIDIAEAKLF